jgi:hypothetical protein
MRRTILALLLCTSSMAICQSIPQPPANSGKSMVEPGSRFRNLSQNWLTSPTTPVQTDPGVSSAWNTPQRNWKINPQQPWSLPGGQQFGKTLMARNERPDPQVPNPKVQPIPTQWPNAKMEPIPTQWPNSKLLPIATQAGSPVMLQAPTYGTSK